MSFVILEQFKFKARVFIAVFRSNKFVLSTGRDVFRPEKIKTCLALKLSTPQAHIPENVATIYILQRTLTDNGWMDFDKECCTSLSVPFLKLQDSLFTQTLLLLML